MSQSLSVSDELYGRPATTARRRGLTSVEQLLEIWKEAEEDGSVIHIDIRTDKIWIQYDGT